jgi:hypothetical protein
MNEQAINLFFESLNYPIKEAISSYATWYFCQAVFLVAGGIFAIYISFFTKTIEKNVEGDVAFFIKCIMAFIGFLFVSFNAPDIIASDAIAIHRLIKDVRG